jgi:hypothetical protein
MLSIHPVPLFQKHILNYQNARICGAASSCIKHKRILGYRSTSFNSSGKEFHGTSSYRGPVTHGRKTEGSLKSASCNACMETEGR